MKIRLPIWAKITALFLTNVVVLTVLLAWIARQQWGIAALPSFRSDKLEQVGEELFRKLEALPVSAWDPLLEEASRTHGITFYLYGQNGARLAGPADFLPGNVHSEITGGANGRRRPPPKRDTFAPNDGPPGPKPEPSPDEATEASSNVSINPRPILSATDGYWSFTRGSLQHAQGTRSVALITRSTSPTGNGFYTNTGGFYWLCAGMLGVSVLVWLPFIHSATRCVRKMQGAASKLAQGDFTARVETKRSDELGALGRSVNHMADQIGSLVDGQKRLLGDIAHELSSPIARMQAILGILESAEANDGTDKREKYTARLANELQQMGTLVQELLSLSKASLRRSIELRPVRLRQQIERCLEREKHNGETIDLQVSDDLSVLGDPELLARAISNILRNAIRYAGHAGPITIKATSSETETILTIQDQGPGVPETSLPRLFDAFYRPDTARTRETGGHGLGLAIVKTCIEAIHGTVHAKNLPQGGLMIEVVLSVA